VSATTFADLARLQPGLLDLLHQAGHLGRTLPPSVERERAWVSIKKRLQGLVGWDAPVESDSPLSTTEAYTVCYDALLRAFEAGEDQARKRGAGREGSGG
jgi:hypothetical protein